MEDQSGNLDVQAYPMRSEQFGDLVVLGQSMEPYGKCYCTDRARKLEISMMPKKFCGMIS